ncbi:polyprenyl synthetase family protein [Streptomyces melanogenes]|uniref:polyprenyl synthetase family protein n=1 Tax=Streptomyces melanogenes TaxID=67326 RepID=UPI00167C610B|nr:polyprenyl synthetase family protein [Streptomyces melanogenes]
MPQPPDLAAARAGVGTVLHGFLQAKAASASAHGLPEDAPRVLRDFLDAGGKRLRPLLCVIGWHAAGGHGEEGPVVRAAAALEMFHTFCLIHDDVMDHSATRRGRPTVHRALATRYRAGRSATAADRLGSGTAILIGDLALAWSDELLHTAGLTARQLAAVLPLIDRMRNEVMYGQYLDLAATGNPSTDLPLALAICRYKTAKYTVERPLHIGATLAGADTDLHAALSDFALPLGESFQLRDDLLGVFGTQAHTGKPVLDDLRDGKHTPLVALALQRAAPAQAAQLRLLLGCPHLTDDQAAVARNIITATGARDTIEQMITDRRQQAERALTHSPIPPATAAVLRHLAHTATRRTA